MVLLLPALKYEDSSIDAYSQQINVNGEDVYVVVLAIGKKPLERLRFIMAHELGHLWCIDGQLCMKIQKVKSLGWI